MQIHVVSTELFQEKMLSEGIQADEVSTGPIEGSFRGLI